VVDLASSEWERGFAAGYAASHRTDVRDITTERGKPSPRSATPRKKRKVSAYSKRYGRAFKEVAPRYKLKSGAWKKDGFKKAQKAAHRVARRG